MNEVKLRGVSGWEVVVVKNLENRFIQVVLTGEAAGGVRKTPAEAVPELSWQ